MKLKKVKTLKSLKKNPLQNGLVTFWFFEIKFFSPLLFFLNVTHRNHSKFLNFNDSEFRFGSRTKSLPPIEPDERYFNFIS